MALYTLNKSGQFLGSLASTLTPLAEMNPLVSGTNALYGKDILQNNRPLSGWERALAGFNTLSFFSGEVASLAVKSWGLVSTLAPAVRGAGLLAEADLVVGEGLPNLVSKGIGENEFSLPSLSRGEYLRQKYDYLTPQGRVARIDELSEQNYMRYLSKSINSQDYVFRYLSEEGLNQTLKTGEIRGYSTTMFSSSTKEAAKGLQILPEWGEPQYGVAIPTNKLNGFQLARPSGNTGSIGWEPFTNSYPSAGAGGWTQFLIKPVNVDNVYIYKMQP